MKGKTPKILTGAAVLVITAGLFAAGEGYDDQTESSRLSHVLYVSNFNTNEVTAYDAFTGQFLGTIVKGGAELQGANGITVGRHGDIFVAGQFSNNVVRYDSRTGRLKHVLDTQNAAGLSAPQGLGFGPDGLLYAASFDNDKIVRFDTSTRKYAGLLCETKLTDTPHMGPIHPLFGHDNDLYIGTYDGHRALKYQGPFSGTAAAATPANLAQPQATTTIAPGTLLSIFPIPTQTQAAAKTAVSRSARMPAVLQHRTINVADANVAAYASGSLADFLASQAALPAGLQNTLLAAPAAPKLQSYFVDYIDTNTFTGQVLQYTTDGTFIKSFVPNGAGGLVLPGGIGVGPDNNLYVANIMVDEQFHDIGSSILKFDGVTGKFLGTFIPPGGHLSVPFAMTFATRRTPIREQ